MNGRKGAAISVGSVLLIFITVLIAIQFYEPITSAVTDANATGTDATILNLTTLLYAVLVMAIVAVEVIVAFKRAS